MTTSDPQAALVPRRRRAAPAAVASLAGSLAVHAVFAAAAAGIAWQLSHDQPVASRDVVIRFEDPSAAEGDEETTNRPAAAAPQQMPVAVPPRRDEPALTAKEAAPELPAPSTDLPPSILTNSPRDRAADSAADRNARIAASSEGATDLGGGVRFAGLGASNARSVVYVVDASGPMVTTMPRVIQELRRSVEQLSPAQKFGVVLFRRTDTRQGPDVFSPVLMRATPSAKGRLVEWLAQIRPTGASNPLTGLEGALALKPDAVFLLSRSIVRSGGGVWQDGLEATLARLEQLNPPSGPSGRRATLIQTIQFLDDDPTGIMQAIGARHGQGAGYRVVRRGEDIAGQAR